jgi:hypothetical protein
MKRLPVTALILAVSVPACKTGGSPDADAQSDASDVEEVTPGDAHDPAHEPHCCPLDVPSCDCTHVGGTPDERGECATVCNVRPEGWMRMIDDEGCFYWHIPADAGSCGEELEQEPEADGEPEPAEEVEEGPEPPPDADTG